MMEFKVGSKVEVLSKKVAIGMWRSAEIVEINGDEYVVRYDAFRGASRMGTFQRVSIEWIRPCPPPTKAGTSWESGDVVEVYDAGFWKVAMIMKVIGEGKYCIRLIGAVEELEVHNSSMRARLAWEDNRWFVMIQAHQTVMQPRDTAAISRSKFEALPSRKQKRMSLNDNSNREGYGFKRRKVSSLFQKPPSPRHSCPLNVEKVETAAYSRGKCLKKLLLSSSGIKMTMESAVSKENKLGAVPHGAIPDLKDSDATESSVGSCSVHSYTLCRSLSHSPTYRIKGGEDDICSDAESRVSFGYREGNCLAAREVDIARMPALVSDTNACTLQAYRVSTPYSLDRVPTSYSHEFGGARRVYSKVLTSASHVYSCTLQSLFESGPSLSWDQEVYLTDLRRTLKIPDDEHLQDNLWKQCFAWLAAQTEGDGCSLNVDEFWSQMLVKLDSCLAVGNGFELQAPVLAHLTVIL
ncbi:DUF724 domain-containing protein, partial [Drosera capensis]